MVNTLNDVEKGLVDKATALIPRLRELAQETEDNRRISEEIMDELKKEGLFKILRPKKYGGYEASLKTYFDCLVEITRGCGSTGWVYSLCNIREFMIAQSFVEETHDEIYGDGDNDVLFAGVFDPREIIVHRQDGGYLIEKGKWMFCSGSVHATWAYLGMPLVDEAGNLVSPGLVTLPFDQLKILDDWYTMGMRGTSSHSIVAENIFIPDNRVVNLTEVANGINPSKHLSHLPEYNRALFPSLNLSLAAPTLGLAKAIFDIFMERLPGRKISFTTYDNQLEAPVTHLQISEASLKIDSAEMHFNRVIDSIESAAKNGEQMSKDAKLKANADLGLAVEYCKEAVSILIGASGGSYVFDANPMQRAFRDFWSIYVHGAILPSSQLESYGRSLVGLEPNNIFV